jgi:hypothetical protein
MTVVTLEVTNDVYMLMRIIMYILLHFTGRKRSEKKTVTARAMENFLLPNVILGIEGGLECFLSSAQ